mmetsp:Transcript_7273/g.17795  ORF Transcript_7273/g.17795 Transcript_7273/m.17795 type:complete len:1226 (-) Transcript_7273:1028-4705(-)
MTRSSDAMTGRPVRPPPRKCDSRKTTTAHGGLQLRWKIREDDDQGTNDKNLFIRLSSDRLVRDLIRLAQNDKEKASVSASVASSETTADGSQRKLLQQQQQQQQQYDDDIESRDHCWTLPPPSSSKRSTTSNSINNDNIYHYLPLKVEVKYNVSSTTTTTSSDGNAATNNHSNNRYESRQEPIQNVFTIYTSYNGGIVNPTCTRTDFHHGRLDPNDSHVDMIEIPKGLLAPLFDNNGNLPPLARTVSVSIVPVVQHSKRVLMEPVTTEDWELLEIHGQTIEHGGLLRQVTVVYDNQHLSLRVGEGNDRVNMIVKEVTSFRDDEVAISRSVWPAVVGFEDNGSANELSTRKSNSPKCTMLMQNTEVVITPKPRPRRQQSSWSTPFWLVPSDEDWGSAFRFLSRYSDLDYGRIEPGCIVVSEKFWEFDSEWATIKKAVSTNPSKKKSDRPESETTLVRIVRSRTIPPRKAALSMGTRIDLGLSLWSDSVSLQPVSSPLELDSDALFLQATGFHNDDETIYEQISVWNVPGIDVSPPLFRTDRSDYPSEHNNGTSEQNNEKLLFPLGTILARDFCKTGCRESGLETVRISMVSSSPSTRAFVAIDDDNVKQFFNGRPLPSEIQMAREHRSMTGSRSWNMFAPRHTAPSESWIHDIIEIIESDRMCMLLHSPSSGMGKTHSAILAGAIGSFRTHRPMYYLDCKKLSKSKPQMMGLLGEMDSFFQKAVDRRDAIIVLDDADHLVPNTFSEGTSKASSRMESTNPVAVDQSKLLADRLSQWLEVSMAPNYFGRTKSRVTLIVTCTTTESLHPSVFQSNSFAVKAMNLPQIPPRDRSKILTAMIRRQCPHETSQLEESDLRDIEDLTDGFYPRDLEKLSLRVQQAIESSGDAGLLLEPSRIHSCILSCLSDFVPLSQLTAGKPGETVATSWSNIGGLFKVKNALETTILHPVLFRRIYSNSSVRLPRGVLLFGESGCGKSGLVPALAKHCNFPLVTCRGPEVLDKYIGASEAKVRQLFERATQMAPSILFIDELDALAPRRGSDSTGVTDRVVNQLLTYLDGVEDTSPTGTVYIIGATSRPDKVDPALIRPGRLEQHLYVGPPETSDEWRDLLIKMSKNWSLDEGCQEYLQVSRNPIEIVESIPRLCPADVRAAFDTAQLKAVHSALKRVSPAEHCDSALISKDDIEAGFREIRPSLQEVEAKSLRSIYSQFQSVGRIDKSRPSGPLKTSLR